MQREKQSRKVVEQPQLEMQKNLYRFDVDGMSTELPTVGKRKEDMQLNLEREQVFHAGEKDMQLKLEREQVLHAGESEPRGVEQP